jgi:hypothetical protein
VPANIESAAYPRANLLTAAVIEFRGPAVGMAGDSLSGFQGAVIFQKISDAGEKYAYLLQERLEVGNSLFDRFHFATQVQRVFPRDPAFLLRSERIALTCAKLGPDFVKLGFQLFYMASCSPS